MTTLIKILQLIDKYKKYLFYALVLSIYTFGVYRCGEDHVKGKSKTVTTDSTITHHLDTIPKLIATKPLYYLPYVFTKSERSKSNTTINRIPGYSKTISSTISNDQKKDTVLIPITQKIYEGKYYKAYVSGYNPNLDSIDIQEKVKTITVTIPAKKVVKKRIRFGAQIGYGITPKGIQPYVGVGLTIGL